MRPRIAKLLKTLGVIIVFAASFAAYDLCVPRTTHLRQFDSDEVARLETAMWRSYYDKERFRTTNGSRGWDLLLFA